MREYGKHKSYIHYQRASLMTAKNNLKKFEKGSDEYIRIKSYINELNVKMSKKFKKKISKVVYRNIIDLPE